MKLRGLKKGHGNFILLTSIPTFFRGLKKGHGYFILLTSIPTFFSWIKPLMNMLIASATSLKLLNAIS